MAAVPPKAAETAAATASAKVAEAHEINSAAPAAPAKKVIPLSEINKHTTRDDLWMAINGKVYNVTKFVDEHPGGEEVLLESAGQDATQAFEDVGHSEYATELLNDMYVGEGDAAELTIRNKPLGVQEFDSDSQSSSSTVVYVILAALVAAGAYLYVKATRG